MKVLFAVSDENISESIVKEYQKMYKEILSYKNVYYFNAIIKELQKDKSYDRIVISEDLEPFASNNYDSIDKFIFEKLDNISDEAIDPTGKETEIILITTERRNFEDGMLLKFFGIGVYNALIGQDKSIENVCELIRKPRTKKEAKQYYKIDSDDVNYQTESENDVSESEIQNILSHYKKLGKNTEKYTDSFNNIISQYNDAQLKIIINFLPVGVKAVLEAESPKYQELVMKSGKNVKNNKNNQPQYTPKKINNYNTTEVKQQSSNVNVDEIKIDMLENRLNAPRMTKPVVIPTELESTAAKRVTNITKIGPELNPEPQIEPKPVTVEIEEEENIVATPKKGRGRPRKIQPENVVATPKKGRGRPRKVQPQDVNLFGLDEVEQKQEESVNLFELETEERPVVSNEFSNSIIEQKIVQHVDLSNLLTREKKVVSFVGTTKNGTSFIVNNLAELFSSMGISTAILDMTQSRNAYYIYTKNEEKLRNIAERCINNLRSNIPEGIPVNKNLTVYTAVPGNNQNIEDVENILTTLVQNYSLVLIDCDFETPTDYFYNSQEIYLVQSMDVLTIQPLTAFLRDLRNKNVLYEQKIKIIINKEQKVTGLSPKVIIGGMAFYNDPTMSFMTELFDRTTVKYTTIPFEMQNYLAYLESLVNCNITLKPYTKLFNAKLKDLANMVYPLLGQQFGKRAFSKNSINKPY